jgi:hypothetical protein
MMQLSIVILSLCGTASLAFRPISRLSAVRSQRSSMNMMSDLVLSAQPTAEEFLDVAEPGLKKATMAMLRAVKEIAYKIRTASCDKMSCFNDFGEFIMQFCKLYL